MKDENRVNLFVDDEFYMGIDAFYLVDLGIKKGMELTDELDEMLKFSSGLAACNKKAFDLLTYRDRTAYELKKKLKEAQFSDSQIEMTTAKLKKLGMISNDGFIFDYINSGKKKNSPNKLMSSLMNMGIPKSAIEPILNENYSYEERMETAFAMLEKKLEKLSDLPLYVKKQKIIAFLMGKGFEIEIILDLINNNCLQDE